MSAPIQSLWIGPKLSVMERLCLRSYLAHGHAVHLYTYGPVANLPVGVVLRDAAEILPEDTVFKYRDHDSYAGFSNYFRYKLLAERGGWWVDTDTVCLKRFAFEASPVFSSEWDNGHAVVTTSTIKTAPAGPVMERAYARCREKDPASIFWGETGPHLLRAVIEECGLEACVRPPEFFCPVGYEAWHTVLDPEAPRFGSETFAVHLWNEMWRRHGQDKNARYAPTCLYEQLKARYLA